jgi:hypothetical protein
MRNAYKILSQNLKVMDVYLQMGGEKVTESEGVDWIPLIPDVLQN